MWCRPIRRRLLSVQHLDPIYADFTITERDLPEVRQEMARGTLRTQVRIPSDPPKTRARGLAHLFG